MGNRAVLVLENKYIPAKESIYQPAIYLHWNGGRDSVEGFLAVARMARIRSDDYGMARMCQIIGNFFQGTLSVGCGMYKYLDTNNFDNGVYLINKDYRIVGRKHYSGAEQNEYTLNEMVHAVLLRNTWVIDEIRDACANLKNYDLPEDYVNYLNWLHATDLDELEHYSEEYANFDYPEWIDKCEFTPRPRKGENYA